MTIAVIKTGGKQYKVAVGDEICVEKIISKDKKLEFTDLLDNKSVTAEIVSEDKEDKIRVFKFKSKKHYKKTFGHRQPFSKILIKEIK